MPMQTVTLADIIATMRTHCRAHGKRTLRWTKEGNLTPGDRQREMARYLAALEILEEIQRSGDTDLGRTRNVSVED